MSNKKRISRVHVSKDFHDWLKLESVKRGKSIIQYSEDLCEELSGDSRKEKKGGVRFDTRLF